MLFFHHLTLESNLQKYVQIDLFTSNRPVIVAKDFSGRLWKLLVWSPGFNVEAKLNLSWLVKLEGILL